MTNKNHAYSCRWSRPGVIYMIRRDDYRGPLGKRQKRVLMIEKPAEEK